MTHLHLVHTNPNTEIKAALVDGRRRINMLPKYFPNTFIVVENAMYQFAEKFCSQYSGAYWHFYELSNGGFYMAPDLVFDKVDVCFPNQFSGKISPNALGIIVAIYVYSVMAEDHPEANFIYLYWKVREFADKHPEASSIYSAID